ncbi:membrane metallo-endopeptidase-like 1 [Ornithodoros turicata]|uniref:membrane metallo-endopeptidase-like 1 n=1 Tax=Ornithodoros turicata TaxID=34597 RepID=UPI003139517E
MSKEGGRLISPVAEKSKAGSEPRVGNPRRQSTAAGSQPELKGHDGDSVGPVEYGDSPRPSVSVIQGEVGNLPGIDEHPLLSIGGTDHRRERVPAKSDSLSPSEPSPDVISPTGVTHTPSTTPSAPRTTVSPSSVSPTPVSSANAHTASPDSVQPASEEKVDIAKEFLDDVYSEAAGEHKVPPVPAQEAAKQETKPQAASPMATGQPVAQSPEGGKPQEKRVKSTHKTITSGTTKTSAAGSSEESGSEESGESSSSGSEETGSTASEESSSTEKPGSKQPPVPSTALPAKVPATQPSKVAPPPAKVPATQPSKVAPLPAKGPATQPAKVPPPAAPKGVAAEAKETEETSESESGTESSSSSETEGSESAEALLKASGKGTGKAPSVKSSKIDKQPSATKTSESGETTHTETTAATTKSTKATTKGTTKHTTMSVTETSPTAPAKTIYPPVTIYPAQPASSEEKKPLVRRNGSDTYNDVHSNANTKRRRIPCLLLVLNILVALVLLLISCISYIIALQHTPPPEEPVTEPGVDHVCRDIQCGVAGTHLFYVLNTSVNPCESIYSYVCKTWMHESPANYRKAVLGAQRVFVDNVYTDMRRILSKPDLLSSESHAIRKATSLYQDCLVKPNNEHEGMASFGSMMSSYELLHWPFRNSFAPQPHRTLAAFIRDSGQGPVVSVKITRDPEGDHKRMIALDCPTFAVPIGTLLGFADHKDFTLFGYKQFITQVLAHWQVPHRESEWYAQNIMAFEVNLANRCNEMCRKKRYKRMTLDEISKSVGNVVIWEQFLQAVFQDVPVQITKDTPVLTRSIRYLKVVSTLFQNPTSLPRMMNYIGWRVAHHFMKQASRVVRQADEEFTELRMKAEKEPYWRKCLRDVNDVMPLAIGRIYIEKVLWRDNHFPAVRIFLTLLEAMDNIINRFPWIGDTVKDVHVKLRNTMDFVISYPIWITNTSLLDMYYSDVSAQGVYFDRFWSAARSTSRSYLRSLIQPEIPRALANFIFPSRIVDIEHRKGPPREKLFYDVRDNTVIVPAGALQPPYYQETPSEGLNFGGLGMLLARDIVNEWFHTSDGLLIGKAKDVYKEKAKCLLDSMKEGLGSKDSAECTSLIADVFALRLAFEAYHIFLAGNDDTTLKGVDFMNPDQLFFVSAVRTLCTSIRERHFANVVLLGKDVLETDMIDRAVMSMREFDDAFNCTHSNGETTRQNSFNKCLQSAAN